MSSLASSPPVDATLRWLDQRLGGRDRRRVILVLAAVLSLGSADQSTVGASATQLRDSLHLTNTDLGLLAAVTGVVGAVATIPFGVLVDRVRRVRLLAIALVGWAVVMAVSASATSFVYLLVVRSALGAVVAIAYPAVASLLGDYFPAYERGRIWGFVLTGELVGSGFGFIVSGGLAAVSWRASFLVLALPALALAFVLRRVREPERGGASRLCAPGEEDRAGDPADDPEAQMSEEQQVAVEQVDCYPERVLDEDPQGWPTWRAVRYLLGIRTNVVLIVSGALGYFFFAGVRSFGVEFVKQQFHIGQGAVTAMAAVLGAFAIAGVLVTGRLSDRSDLLNARIWIGLGTFVGATVLFVPGLLVTSLGLGIAAIGGAAFFLSGANPPLDAARLDIVPPTLWGRAEAVRTVLRQPAEALAPLLFGVLADNLAGGGHSGLQLAFLLMLVPLAVAAAILLLARRSYPRDVATAAESIMRIASGNGHR